jgi:putative protease
MRGDRPRAYLLPMSRPVPELLAPAGSLDAVRAAVANGADAVYLRRRALQRPRRRRPAHARRGRARPAAWRTRAARGCTSRFNILFKPAELADALAHLGECVDRGIDAAIVQDLGARPADPASSYPALRDPRLHPDDGARRRRRPGAGSASAWTGWCWRGRTRWRTSARSAPRSRTLGLESFVHGALCIAYSGQCYMSGMISERSRQSRRLRAELPQGLRPRATPPPARSSTGATSSRAKDLGGVASTSPPSRRRASAASRSKGARRSPSSWRRSPAATATSSSRVEHRARGRRRPCAEVQPLVQIFSRGFHRRHVRRARGARLHHPRPAGQSRNGAGPGERTRWP